MKNTILVLLLIFGLVSIVWAKDVSVKGYWKDTDSDGIKDTYVQPSHRTSPNNNMYDNYSTKGNVNPWTGQPGTVSPEKQYNNQYQNPYEYNNNYRYRK